MLTDALLIFATPYVQENTARYMVLKNHVATNQYCSGSVLLSLAAHITHSLPYLDLFDSGLKSSQISVQSHQINSYMSMHPFQELWCDLFSFAIMKNHCIRKQRTLYLIVELRNQKFDQLKQHQQIFITKEINYSTEWIDKILLEQSGYERLPRKNLKIAILNVSGSQLRTDRFRPIINVRAIILGQIYDNENWLTYEILKGEVPTQKEFLTFNAVILPGSTNSVLTSIPFVNKMAQQLFSAFNKSKKLKIIGICYGHQLIAKFLGGLVVRKVRADKIQTYQIDQEKILELKQNFTFLQNYSGDIFSETLMLEHHQDYVEQVPSCFEVLAKSQTSIAQSLLHKSGRILTFQSHPQYYYEFTQGYIHRLMIYENSSTPCAKMQRIHQNVSKLHHASTNRMRKTIAEFLNWSCQGTV